MKRRDDQGFTLIELMVVVLVLGILLAIAIPTFTGARSRAQNTAAQSSLRNSLTVANVVAIDNAGAFTTATCAGMAAAEPALTFVHGGATGLAAATTAVTNCVLTSGVGPTNQVSAGPTTVSIDASASQWTAAAYSSSGTCYWIRSTSAGAVTYARLTTASTNCHASYSTGVTYSATGWS
jgi:type IV pilus assembly protein PilA